MVEMRSYSDDELKAMLEESREASKHSRKLGRVMGIVADRRLQQLKYFQAREHIATWRRTHGYDRDDSWMHCTRPLSPEEFTQNLWSEVNTLKDAISMPRQKVRNLINAVEQFEVSDEEFAVLKRLVEKRDRDAAYATVAPVDTAQYRSLRSLTPEIPPDVCVSLEEKNEEGRMNPEPTELEPPLTGTGLETPGQQCPPNEETCETGRTIADGYLLVGMGSNQGAETSSPTERVDTRAGTATTAKNSSNTISRKARRKPRDKTLSKENKQFDPGGKGEKPPPWNAAVMVSFFFFRGGTLGRGMPVAFASCSLSLCACLSVPYSSFYQVITFKRAEKDERRRGSSR